MTRQETELPELVARAELVPPGSVGRERGPTVEAFEELARPVGPVLAGRFFKPRDPAPALLPLGDRLGLVGRTSLRVVDLPSGDVAWSVTLADGTVPIVRGGLVGDDVTLLTSGRAPSVLTLDGATGELVACAEVPLSGPSTGQPPATLQTDQAGPDVVVVAGRTASPVTAARLPVLPGEPEGSATWRRQLTGVTEAGGVSVVGERVVLSRVVDPVRLAEMAVAGGIGSPLVTTYDVATGEPGWTYPADGEPGERAATLLGEIPETGGLLVLEAAPGRDDRVTRTEWTLVALDADGQQQWRRPLGPGLASGSVWGDRVVVQGPAPGGGARLRAFDLDGRPVWSLSTPDLPFGEQRDNFGPATTVGQERLVPAPNGLVALDPETGQARPLNVREPVDELVVVGEHLVVRSGPALLVLAVRSPL